MLRKIIVSAILFSGYQLHAQNFYVPHTLNVPSLPSPTWQIECADVDLNGYEDLITANNVTHELLVYENTYGVVDSVPLSYPADIDIFWLADWNNDGRKDVVTTNKYGVNFQLILNNPSGGFFAPVSFSNVPSGQIFVNTISVKDLNADNFPDLIFNRSDTTFLLFNNVGSTSLTSQGIKFNATYHGQVCFTDVNADGNIDAIVGIWDVVNHLAVVYQNTGSFNFTAVDTIAFTNGANEFDYLYTQDLTNDGTDEILGIVDGQLYIAQKTSGFQFNQIYTSSFLYVQSAGGYADHRGLTDFADVDGNGYQDLIIANSVYFNTNGIFTKVAISTPPDFQLAYIKAIDSDNNGVQELWWNMYQYYDYGNSCMFSVNYNAGTTLNPRVLKWNVNPFIDYGAYEQFIDFDNDGDRDFMYHSAGRVMIAVNDGNDNFTDVTAFGSLSLSNGDVNVVDMDEDGLPDLLLLNGNLTNYNFTYYRNIGNNQFQSMGTVFNFTYPHYPHLIAHDDLDNDGIRDFVFMYPDPNQIKCFIEVFKNNLTTFPSQGVVYIGTQATDITPLHGEIADLDGNGFKDLMFDYSSGVSGNHGRYGVLMNNGAFAFTNPLNIPFNSVDYRIGLADVNSDGREDLLVSRYDNFFQTSRIKARINNGNGTFGGEIDMSAAYSANYGGFFTTDVNNDGLKDVVSQYNFSVAINNGSGFDAWIQNGTPASSGEYPVQLDIDGDGDMDLLNGDTHTWFDNTSISPNKINGTVFYDVNANGTKDAGDIDMKSFPVSTIPLVAITNTDTSGQFSMRMGSSTGTFGVQSKSKWNSSFTFTTSPYPDSASINTANPIDNVSIGFYASGGIHQAQLDQSISAHRCNEQARLWINTTNFSPLASTITVQLTLPVNATYAYSSIAPASQAGNQVSWNFSTTAFQEKNFWVNVNMPNSNFIGDTIIFISTLASTQPSGTINVNDTLPVVLKCAFDPNDKLTVPLSTQLSGDKLYAFDDYVEYQVRFQNTGTDTAQTVVIKDLLNTNFDLSTIEIISASNDFSFMVENNRLLTVTFNNIQLPDSGTDFTGSMGYVKFGIRLFPNTPHNILIRNVARIYFDQNDAVVTNVVDLYRVACRDFVTPIYSSTGFCSGTSYTAHINNHSLNAEYTWSLDGTVIAINDSAQFTITHTGNNLLNIHLDLGVCQYDSLRTYIVSQTASALLLNTPADTSICPRNGIGVFSNFNSNWFRNDSLIATNVNIVNGYGGDTIVAVYTSGFCVSRAQTILRDLFPLHPTLLTNSSIHPNQSNYGCEATNYILSAWNNVVWEWSLDNYPAPLFDTSTSISIYLDPLAAQGSVSLTLDTLGCYYGEYYGITINHAASISLVANVDSITICPGYTGDIYFNIDLDSLQLYNGGIYDTTIISYIQSTPLSFAVTGAYTAIGYSQNCAHPNAYFNVVYSTAPSSTVGVINNVLFTSDGMLANWFYSIDSTTFNYIGTFDSLYSQPDGYYYFDGVNSDGCYGFSPVYYFLHTGINELQNGTVSIHYNAFQNDLLIDGLTSATHPQLNIFNQQGQNVYEAIALQKNKLPVFPAGVYVVKIKTDSGVFVIRMLIYR